MNYFTPSPRMHSAPLRRRARQAGATMVEFLIVTPFALMLVLGIVQLGLMYTAKHIVNEATFVAARAGSVNYARKDAMRPALIQALIPFYQNTLDSNPAQRILTAWGRAQGDLLDVPQPLSNLEVTILNPTDDAFTDFGLIDPKDNHTFIPNDSLEYRDYTILGPLTGLSIEDANVLRIKVTYAYELKVPLMQSIIRTALCGFDSGVNAFGRGGAPVASAASDCVNYYSRGRVPIVAYATVQMQTPAWQPN
jgi:TadE-like protein